MVVLPTIVFAGCAAQTETAVPETSPSVVSSATAPAPTDLPTATPDDRPSELVIDVVVGEDVVVADLRLVQSVPLGDGPDRLGIVRNEDNDLLSLVPSGFGPVGVDAAWVVDPANGRVVVVRAGAAVPSTAVPLADLAGEDAVTLMDGTLVVVERADGANLVMIGPDGEVSRTRVVPSTSAGRLIAGELVADGQNLALWAFASGLTRYDGLYQLPMSELGSGAESEIVHLPPANETGMCRESVDCLELSFTSENQLTVETSTARARVTVKAGAGRDPFVSLNSLVRSADIIDLLLDVGGECAGCSGFYWLRLDDDDLHVVSWLRVSLEDEAEHSPQLRSRLRRAPDGTFWVFDVTEDRFELMQLLMEATAD